MFIILVNFMYGGYIKSRIPLQERVEVDLKVRGSYLKTKYVIRFSTEEKKNNFKILSKEKNKEI
ncbi:hypothetical protein [Fusobacterium sp.]|uniref:hypothetical protein n=1 Tax=Fusobacterium sp. TaxID=68766 RepID=UPI002638CD00|nr:hypothetical protein [Fusobacterium sp.]